MPQRIEDDEAGAKATCYCSVSMVNNDCSLAWVRGSQPGVRDGHSDFCTVMLSSSCANSSAHAVSNYSMPSARPSFQPGTMLISKKKGQHMQFHSRLQNWCTSWPRPC